MLYLLLYSDAHWVTFFWYHTQSSFFYACCNHCNCYFWQCSALNLTYFPIPVSCFKNGKYLVPPGSTPKGRYRHTPLGFYRKFNFTQFLFETFFNTIGTFGSVFGLKVNLLFHSSESTCVYVFTLILIKLISLQSSLMKQMECNLINQIVT